MNDTIGMIGLGNAGSALASALSGQRPLVGHDVSPARRGVGRLARLQIRAAELPCSRPP